MTSDNWGGARQGSGRPRGARNKVQKDPLTNRTARIVVSCTKEEAQLIKEKAIQAGMSVTAFMLSKVL